FWVDMTRATLYILLPLSIIVALAFAALGVPQTLSGSVEATTLEGVKQVMSIGLAPAVRHRAQTSSRRRTRPSTAHIPPTSVPPRGPLRRADKTPARPGRAGGRERSSDSRIHPPCK